MVQNRVELLKFKKMKIYAKQYLEGEIQSQLKQIWTNDQKNM